MGPHPAAINVVEYGHYESGDCAGLQPYLRELLRTHQPAVRLTFRHFPLPVTTVHPHTMLAAEMAEAAAVRGRFWPVHEWLLDHHGSINRDTLHQVEMLFDLPPEAIGLELSQQIYRARVMRDVIGGRRSGVLRTPTFFVNGERVNTGTSLDDIIHDLSFAIEQPPQWT